MNEQDLLNTEYTPLVNIHRVGTKKHNPKNQNIKKKPPEMCFFAIFHCKSPCCLPKFDLEYFNALLKDEPCVKIYYCLY